jgi:DNA-binding winged helix-turn-helix (wHTH) protein
MGAEPSLRSFKLGEGIQGLRFGPFELDLESVELRKSGVRVKLQLQPFRVLVLLARQPGRVLTREEIQREVWPDGTFVDFEQALNFCIRQIRAALGDQAATPRYVETLPRRGYRFIGPVALIGAPATPSLPDPAAPQALEGVDAASTVRGPLLFALRTGEAGPPQSPVQRRLTAGLAVVAAVMTAVAGWLAIRPPTARLPASFHRITFGRGYVGSARFGPGGRVLYSAAWEGRPPGVYSVGVESLDSRGVASIGPRLVAVSEAGEAAFFEGNGTLRRAPLAGGPAKDVLENVMAADWMRNGSDFVVARSGEGRSRIEFPPGKLLCEATWPSHLRLSPDGKRVAFLEHPLRGDDRGAVVVVDGKGDKRTLSSDWASTEGLAWSPDGREVWFTAARVGADSALHAVALDGRERMVVPALGRLILHDIAPDGAVLLERNTLRLEVRYRRSSEPEERDLSWLDLSRVVQLSSDGNWLLTFESGEGGGPDYSVYLRRTEGSVPIRIGTGRPTGLSGDGRWVLSLPLRNPDHVDLLPTGAGEPRSIRDEGFTAYEWAGFLPDGESVVVTARKGVEEPRMYRRRLAGGPATPLTPPGVAMWHDTLSPDGRRFVAPCRRGGEPCLHFLDGGDPRPVPGLDGSKQVLGWSGSESLYLRARDRTHLPVQLERLDLATGRARPWLVLAPADRSGVRGINSISVTADGTAYAYSYSRQISDLYVVRGLH